MRDTLVTPGVFPDVAAANGLFWVLARIGPPTQAGHVALFMWGGERVTEISELSRIAVPAGSPAFPKLDIVHGDLWCAHHDGQVGILRNATTNETIILAPCQNNDPICFGGGFVAWQGAAADGWPITRMDLGTRQRTDAGRGQGTGLSRVLDGGRVVLVDADRLLVPGGTRPSWAGDLAVVESHTNKGVRGRLNDGRECSLWTDIQIVTPRCAFEPSLGLYGVVGWSNQDGQIRAAVLQASDFSAPQPDPIPPINRALWVGPYEFMAAPEPPPGNCIVACDPIGDVPFSGLMTQPTIVATSKPVAGPVIGQYCAAGTVEEIEQQARETPHRAVAYWDKTRRWPRLPNLPPNAWLCVKAYCLNTETPASFERDIAAYVTELSPRQVVIVCQGYTNNTDHTDNLAALVSVYARLATLPNVVALLIFSDYGRKTGLQDHPDVRALWQRVAQTVTQPPMTTMPKPPRFTISAPSFPITAEIDPGGSLRLPPCVATLEPGAGEFDWIEWRRSKTGPNGPWTVEVRNPGHDKDHTFTMRAGTEWFGATAGNAVGKHHTGAERKVTVTERVVHPPPPPPPPPPPAPTPPTAGVAFKTAGKDDGTPFWLSVGPDGLIEAKATSATADNVARIVATKDGDLWTLKVGEKFIRAVKGGGGKLIADREPPASLDEHFTLTLGGDGLWTIQTRTMKFAHAEFGGGGKVVANKTIAGAHEFFDAAITGGSGPLPGIVKRTGFVGRDRRCYADAGGAYLAFGFSLFAAGSLFKDNRAGLDEDCGNLAARRANCVRWMGEVGKPLFEGRELDPTASDYEDIVRGTVRHMYDNFGLRSNFVIFGGTDWNVTAAQREAQVDRIARIFQDLKDATQRINIVNEGWQTYKIPGMDQGQQLAHAKEMARRLKSQLNVLVGVTDVPGLIGDFYTGTVADIGDQHLDRSDSEDRFRHSRLAREARINFPPIWSLEEPRGIKSSVKSEEDPKRLIADMVNGYLCGFGEYIFHTGAGVTSGGPKDTHVHGEKRIFDHPTARAAVDAMAAALSYLPPDIPNWDLINWWEGRHPFIKSLELFENGRRIGQDFNNEDDQPRGVGMVCHFAAERGGQWVSMPTGIHQRVVLSASRGMEFDVHDHLTGEVLEHVERGSGQAHELLGPERGGHLSYILTGRYK